MALIHHIAVGYGQPPIVFVHGFACAHTDWDTQVAHLAPYHQTIAVDLRGHGASPGSPDECSIERYGADVAEVMHHLNLAAAVLVGHSMGCRVVIEAALQAPIAWPVWFWSMGASSLRPCGLRWCRPSTHRTVSGC